MQTFWVKLTQELDHRISLFLRDWNQNQYRETKKLSNPCSLSKQVESFKKVAKQAQL